MKSNLQKSCTKLLIFSILLSICFIAGVPTIIIGAKNNKIIMTLGIIMTVVGFYGSPMAWVNYGHLVSSKSILYAIVDDNLTSASDIANNLGLNTEEIISKINYLIQKRYLTGYKLEENGKITKLEKQKQETKEIKSKKCPNCGANLTETKDHKYQCKYCGEIFDK